METTNPQIPDMAEPTSPRTTEPTKPRITEPTKPRPTAGPNAAAPLKPESTALISSFQSLIQLNGKIASICYAYIAVEKRELKYLHKLANKLNELNDMLNYVRDIVKEYSEKQAVAGLDERRKLLKECSEDLGVLLGKIEPSGGFKGVVDGLEWPLDDVETKGFKVTVTELWELFKRAVIWDLF